MSGSYSDAAEERRAKRNAFVLALAVEKEGKKSAVLVAYAYNHPSLPDRWSDSTVLRAADVYKGKMPEEAGKVMDLIEEARRAALTALRADRQKKTGPKKAHPPELLRKRA